MFAVLVILTLRLRLLRMGPGLRSALALRGTLRLLLGVIALRALLCVTARPILAGALVLRLR